MVLLVACVVAIMVSISQSKHSVVTMVLLVNFEVSTTVSISIQAKVLIAGALSLLPQDKSRNLQTTFGRPSGSCGIFRQHALRRIILFCCLRLFLFHAQRHSG